MRAQATAPPMQPMNRSLRSLRFASRWGSRLMRGMSVEAPQRQSTRRQQGGRIALHRLRLGARGQLHLSERLTLLRGDADAAGDDFRHARDVGTAAADQDLLRLLASGARGKVELQRASDLWSHVVDEGIEHLGLIVA